MTGVPGIRVLAERVLDQRVSYHDIDLLVRHLRRMASFVLHVRHRRAVQRFAAMGYTLADIALRSVEHLVLEKGGVRCCRLHRYLSVTFVDRERLTDAAVEEALGRVLHTSVQDTVAELLAELDPEYSRIRRTILANLRCDTRFTVEHGAFRIIVRMNGEEAGSRQCSDTTSDELLGRLAAEVRYTASVRELVEALFAVTREAGERACLPLGTIVHVVHQYYRLYHRVECVAEPAVMAPLDEERMTQLRSRAVNTVRGTLLRRYAQRQLVTDEEATAIVKALESFLDDLMRQEQKPLFEYYRDAHPDADYEAYRCRERNRFEYIMQVGKDAFRRECERNLLG
jgi:hypothetical protein